MKQLMIFIILAFLSIPLLKAQKTIGKDDFERLVDYANCRYVQAFIEKNDAGKPYFVDTYEKKIRPELVKASIDNLGTIISYQRLEELLVNNTLALELAKRINDRKLRFDESQDDEALINSLAATGWENVDLINTATNIQTEILAKYILPNKQNSFKVSESEVVKTQTIQTSRQVEDLQLKLEKLQQQYENLKNDTKIIEYQKSLDDFKAIVFSLLGFLLLLIVAIYILVKKIASRNSIIKHVLGSERIAERFNPKIDRRTNFATKPYVLTESDINNIVDRVLKSLKISETVVQTPEPTRSTPKYLKGKSGKIFSRVENTPDNSFFKLFNESGDSAKFEFSGDESEAIAKRIFSDDICIIVSGGYQNAQVVKNHAPGKLKRVNENWEVIEPLKIKLV